MAPNKTQEESDAWVERIHAYVMHPGTNEQDIEDLEKILKRQISLKALFTQLDSHVPEQDKENAPAAGTAPAPACLQAEAVLPETRDISRNMAMENDVRLRDGGKCLLSGTTDAVDVCRILPFGSYSTYAAREYQQSIWCLSETLSGHELAAQVRRLLDGKDSAEHAWNAICMTPDLATLFAAGSFALKPHGYHINVANIHCSVPHYSVSIEYIELYNNGRDPNAPCRPFMALFESRNERLHSQGDLPAALQPIKSGSMFRVRLPSEDFARNMVHALQFRYNATMAQFFAGAAGRP